MARYLGARCRLCRREGQRLYLKGERCYGSRCALEQRNTPPGEPKLRRQKPTDYAIRLRAKQKARRIYGVLEKQFRRYFEKATRMGGVTGENLLQLLERRLDNVVYRLGLATSRAQARQWVRHRHILVNGRIVDIPSYSVKEGDEIQVKDKSRNIAAIQQALEIRSGRGTPEWLELEGEIMKGRVVRLPVRSDIGEDIEEQLIVEFYSR